MTAQKNRMEEKKMYGKICDGIYIEQRKTAGWRRMEERKSKKRTGRRKILFLLTLAVILPGGILCFAGGEMKELGNQKTRENVDYVICKESHLPEQLKNLLKEKQKKPRTCTYRPSMAPYLVVCYGEKPYSGYSIKEEDCHRTKDVLYLRTQLMGPAKGEKITETRTYPHIVLRCRQTKVLCIIDS